MDDATALARAIGKRVQESRSSSGWTQRQLAEEAGVSERLIRSLEMGTAPGIGLNNLSKILLALGLHLTIAGADGETALSQKKAVTQDPSYSRAMMQAVNSWLDGDDRDE